MDRPLPVDRLTLLPLLAAALALGLAPGCAKEPDPFYDVSAAPARYRAVAETFAREAQRLDAPGAAIGIIEGGELVWAAGVGRKEPFGGARVGPATLFRIGSVTKMMTALAVMQEVEAGRVALDDTLVTHVPGFHLAGEDVSGITVRNLLDQTTGIYDYLEVEAPEDEQTDAALAGFLTGRFGDVAYLMSPPGRFYNYSNPNFMLAGLVAETTSGVPYRQLMAERVLGPLGMDRTLFLGSDVLADGDFAVGATDAVPAAHIPARVEPDSFENPWGRPAGFAWSSVEDLARFAKFLIAGNAAVLSAPLHAEMTSPANDTLEFLDLIHYGFGLQTTSGFFLPDGFHEVKTVAHTGAIAGFSASVFLLPELGFGVITLASGDGAGFGETLVSALGTLPTLPAPVEGPDFAPDPLTFAEEVGTYEDPHLAGTVTVSLSGGKLRVSAPAAEAEGIPYDPVLVPQSPHNFLLTVDGFPLLATFIHGAPGEPTWLRTRLFVAARAPAAPPAALAAPAAPRGSLRDALRSARALSAGLR